MKILEFFLMGVGLSMDAFAVSVCKGLEQKKFNVKNMIIIAFLFGFFQFAMPVIAYYCCRGFSSYIEDFDHWIAFALLEFIGIKMIIETIVEIRKEKRQKQNLLNKKEDFYSQSKINLDEKSNTNNTNKSNNNNEMQLSSNKNNNEVQPNSNNIEQVSSKEIENKKLNFKELFILALATSIDALVVGITLALTDANIFLASGIIGIVTFAICCCGVFIGFIFGSKFKSYAEILGGLILILIGVKILFEHLGFLAF